MKRTTTWLLGICLLVAVAGCGGNAGSADQPTGNASATTQPEVVLPETTATDSKKSSTDHTTEVVDEQDTEAIGELPEDVDTHTLELLRIASDAWKINPVEQGVQE